MVKVTVTMGEASKAAALYALGAFLDNEHDKGCDDSELTAGANSAFDAIIAAPAGRVIPLSLMQAAALEHALDVYGSCYDPADTDDPCSEEYRACATAHAAFLAQGATQGLSFNL